MNYLDEVEKELREMCGDEFAKNTEVKDWIETIVTFVKEKILESYKNGLAAAKKSKQSYASQSKYDKKWKREK